MADSSKPQSRFVVRVTITEITDAWNEPKKPNYPQDGSIYHEAAERRVLDVLTLGVDKDTAIDRAQRQLATEQEGPE